MSTDLKPELIYYAGNALLEGPLWNDEDGDSILFRLMMI